MAEDARLARIETKLDQMGEAIIALARMEERMITLFTRMDLLDQAHVLQTSRLSLVETNAGASAQRLRFAERVFWIVVTAGIALIFSEMKGL